MFALGGSANLLPDANGYDEKIADNIINPPTVYMKPLSIVEDIVSI